MKTTILFAICAIFGLGALGSFGCGKAESYEKPLTPVKLKAIERQFVSGESGGEVRYSANIQPDTQLDLAFKTGGLVRELAQVRGRTLQEGDWIEKGVTLARLGDEEFAARIRQARARLAEAQAEQAEVKSQSAEARAAQDQLKRELDRAARLLEAESLIEPEFESVKARFEMGQARIEALQARSAMALARTEGAKAQLEEAERARTDCELRAPMDGVLLKRSVEVGSFVAPGAPAFVLADTAWVKAVFGVPDVSAATLKQGSLLTVTTEAMRGVEYRGRLARVAPAADAKTRVFDVEALIPNPRRRLKPGMVVSLEIAGGNKPAPVLAAPLAALFQLKEKDGGYAVFVVVEQGGKQTARLRRVTPGQTLGNLIAIAGGVDAGEQVVVSGATLIADGEQVRVIP